MNKILGIFLIGIVILIGAIIINVIAKYLDIDSWFDFIEKINKNGFKNSIGDTSIISYVFMFIIYPFLLGVLGYYSYILLKF